MTGLIVALAVLAAATALGLARGRRDGRFRMYGVGVRPDVVPDTAAGSDSGPGTAAPADRRRSRTGPVSETAPAGVGALEPGTSHTLPPADAGSAEAGAVGPRISTASAVPGGSRSRLTADELGVPLGQRATLVQFSTVFCQPCRAARQVLGAVAREVPGVVHVDIDAESHLDLVRRHHVTRTPTILLLDSAGAVAGRTTGAPRRAQVLAALAAVMPEPSDS